MSPDLRDIGLLAILAVVLVGPFLNKKVERNLEAFLGVMGVLAVTVAGSWGLHLVGEAASEPVIKGIVPAVLVAGLLFLVARRQMDRTAEVLQRRVPIRALVFALIFVLGLLSSVITAIIAALVLVELVLLLPLTRAERVRVIVAACFAIGLGAALTPIGEPLSTIAIAKLKGEPYHAGFFFLFDKLAWYILPGVAAFAAVGAFMVKGRSKEAAKEGEEEFSEGTTNGVQDAVIRAVKVYIFVAALIFLGSGFQRLIDKYLTDVGPQPLFWANITSSILDNATLTAAEIGPKLRLEQIQGALMGLLVAGGMLIPGNIPNIISAHKLRIGSKEWAKVGIPLGLVAMVGYFVWLFYLPWP